MLGNYERRHFQNGETVWLGRYRNLTNVLHWHFECELIRVVEGTVTLKIGDRLIRAGTGECFFCAGEELHYILSDPDAQVDIAIFDEGLTRGIADKYVLTSPKLSRTDTVHEALDRIRAELTRKEPFYQEAVDACVRGLMVDVYRNAQTKKREEESGIHKKLIGKINEEFALISFEEAARFSGYSPSHFSKMFKKLTGRTFSEYLNMIRVEHAILLMRGGGNLTMTEIASKCGFSTVRNFNRVFKGVTGASPRMLPEEFDIDVGVRISPNDHFDPTDKKSTLL